MRRMTRWMVGALVATALAGCGRTPFEAAPAPSDQLPLQAVGGASEAGTVTLTDGGTDAFVELNGTGFRSDGVYTTMVADLTAGFPEVLPRGYFGLTASDTPMTIRADGSTYFFGSFSIRDVNPSWDAIVVLRHPDGNPDMNGNEQVVLQTSLPARFRP